MLKVFLVEDESVVREALRDNIPWQQYGYRFVGEAGDGEMALPLIRKTMPDVLITDIKMPFMDGLALSHMVKQEYPDMKIIIISGYDDFDYARQAIAEGVEQYLLKPITRSSLQKALAELREKIEAEREQKNYMKKFQSDMQEYEQYFLRNFFEKVFEGKLSVQEIYELAGKHNLDIEAPCYNLMLLSVQAPPRSDNMLQRAADDCREELMRYFLRFPECIAFRWNVSTYGVMIKGEPESISERTKVHMAEIERICTQTSDLEWYAAAGEAVERFSMLGECYSKLNHRYAYRYLAPGRHILTEDAVAIASQETETGSLRNIDINKVDPEIIRGFLNNGQQNEVQEFVENYMETLGDAIHSRLFRDYLLLNIQFTVQAYVEGLGCSQQEFLTSVGADQIHELVTDHKSMEEYVKRLFVKALCIRDEKQSSQGKKVLRQALDYIEANYTQPTLSLNEVAGAIEMSPNYFSAMFSQEMKQTFVEYVTARRMELAKKLLQENELSASEIAAAVGYKDSHYFSFVFKKTQGCSPREYRSGAQQ
ncbi:MAG: response regulator [bacterium]|nr:response regulator [bacterium]